MSCKFTSKHINNNTFGPGFTLLLVSNWFDKKGEGTDPGRLALRADKTGGNLCFSLLLAAFPDGLEAGVVGLASHTGGGLL